MDARSLFLTPNSTTVYAFMCIDVKDGPVVVQVPPGVLGPADDAYFRFVTDVGLTGPDQGKGGKYLFVPLGYSGAVPSDGYLVAKTPMRVVTVSGVVMYGGTSAEYFGSCAAAGNADRSSKAIARCWRGVMIVS